MEHIEKANADILARGGGTFALLSAGAGAARRPGGGRHLRQWPRHHVDYFVAGVRRPDRSSAGLLREQRMRIFYVEGGPERGQFHHKRILEAVEQRDPEKAREAMRAHLQQVRKDARSSAVSGDPPV